jgi:hypothetical protein
MKRKVIAAVWILGATVPLLAATVYLVGCCVLPFHQAMHEVVPLCHIAMSATGAPDAGERDALPPARDKEEAGKRVDTNVRAAFRLGFFASQAQHVAAPALPSHRSFLAHGAMRCDQDVGLHVLVETFRI